MLQSVYLGQQQGSPSADGERSLGERFSALPLIRWILMPRPRLPLPLQHFQPPLEETNYWSTHLITLAVNQEMPWRHLLIPVQKTVSSTSPQRWRKSTWVWRASSLESVTRRKTVRDCRSGVDMYGARALTLDMSALNVLLLELVIASICSKFFLWPWKAAIEIPSLSNSSRCGMPIFGSTAAFFCMKKKKESLILLPAVLSSPSQLWSAAFKDRYCITCGRRP